MLELKDAVSKSLSVIKETFSVPPGTPVELEEAKLQDEPEQWLLTFSYPDGIAMDSTDIGANLRAILGKRRAYKEIRIRVNDGAVTGVRNIHA